MANLGDWLKLILIGSSVSNVFFSTHNLSLITSRPYLKQFVVCTYFHNVIFNFIYWSEKFLKIMCPFVALNIFKCLTLKDTDVIAFNGPLTLNFTYLINLYRKNYMKIIGLKISLYMVIYLEGYTLWYLKVKNS